MPPGHAAGQAEPGPDHADRTAAIQRRSGGAVVAISPDGPVLAGHRAPSRSLCPNTVVAALGLRDRILVAVLTAAWVSGVAGFWWWWLQPEHRTSWISLLVASVVPLYLSCEPIGLVIAANRQRQINPGLPVPELRVAFAVTRAPSEPWALARTTLTAMLMQEYPHSYDVWLCDEQPTAEVVDWCARKGVHIASRSDAPAYHHDDWPRRARCKEGNLAYFYDHVAYLSYDVVAQLDCDHVPAAGYLAEMIRPFTDPAIGYVAAPSVCDRGTANSWSARGRLHREAQFHGPVQLGHNGGLAPLCVGSHYAVRTAAIRQIGGIGPELLEDFSTSFLLNSAGWQGAFAITAEAHGNGPLTFPAMLKQEFQWTRSLAALLHRTVPANFSRLSWRLRLRYLYTLLTPGALVTAMGTGLGLVAVATATGEPAVAVNPLLVLLFWTAIPAPLLVLSAVLKQRFLSRPVTAPVLSWENCLYRLTRWPIVACGLCAAALQRLRPRPITFEVTPKSVDGLTRLPATLIAPYVVLSVLLAGTAIVGEVARGPGSYVLLCLLGALAYLVVPFAVCLLHASEGARTAAVSMRRAIGKTASAPLLISLLTIPPVAVAIACW
jgi:hypothetical protein